MPRITGKEVDMSITGKRLLVPRKPEKSKEKRPKKGTLNRVYPRNEVLTQEKVIQKYLERPRLKLPDLARTSRLTNEERFDLQALLRVRCFDFPLQIRQLIPEWTRTRSNSKSTISSSSCFRHHDPFTGGRGITRKRFPFIVYDKNYQGDGGSHDDRSKTQKKLLPLKSSFVEGQRVNLRDKYNLEGSELEIVNRYSKRKAVGKPAPWNNFNAINITRW